MTTPCFRMKGTTLTSIVLEVVQFDTDEFDTQLAAKVASAPQFFQRSSLILNLLQVPELTAEQLTQLVQLCRRHGLQPMAVRGIHPQLAGCVAELGLSDITESKATEQDLSVPKTSVSQVEPAEITRPTKIIQRPVRSGQQVYAQGADLIILAPVSEGAEILADGNIHVYSILRGRALAGVKGDQEARIFCQQLEAELLSIAGRFVLQDNIQSECWKKPAQAYLDNDALLIAPLN